MNITRLGLGCLLGLITLTAPLFAQSRPRASVAVANPPLTIIVLEGQDAVNSLETMNPASPVVEVRNSNDLPVEGATVEFRLPESGAGGEFLDGSKRFRTTTNLQGQARGPYRMSSVVGEFMIEVDARIDTRQATIAIRQRHIAGSAEEYIRRSERRWYKSWKVWAVIGGAAVAAIIVTSSKGDDSVTIRPGPPTVGRPN